jgi:hypothetical protein
VRQAAGAILGLSVLLLGAALLLVPAASAVRSAARKPPVTHVWSGQWVTNSNTGGGFALRAMASSYGIAAMKELRGQPCVQPTTYYRGGYYDPSNGRGGKVVGCTDGASFLARYLGDPKEDPGAAGGIDVDYIPPKSPTDRPAFAGTYKPDATGGPYKYIGVHGQDFDGDGCCSPLVVTFTLRLRGKPNLAIKGPKPDAVTSATLSVSGAHATFTKVKQPSPVLEATETKGHIVLDEVLADGTKRHFQFGIISGTLYAPTTRRLALLLEVEQSNDPACPAVGHRAATLNVLPSFQGVRDTIILFGIPYSQNVDPFGFITSQPCKGQAFGWETGSGGVFVRALLAESTPGASS